MGFPDYDNQYSVLKSMEWGGQDALTQEEIEKGESLSKAPSMSFFPTWVKGLPKVETIASGADHMLALTTDKEVENFFKQEHPEQFAALIGTTCIAVPQRSMHVVDNIIVSRYLSVSIQQIMALMYISRHPMPGFFMGRQRFWSTWPG